MIINEPTFGAYDTIIISHSPRVWMVINPIHDVWIHGMTETPRYVVPLSDMKKAQGREKCVFLMAKWIKMFFRCF